MMGSAKRDDYLNLDGYEEEYEDNGSISRYDPPAQDSRTSRLVKSSSGKRMRLDSVSAADSPESTDECESLDGTGTSFLAAGDRVSTPTLPKDLSLNTSISLRLDVAVKHKSKPGILYISRIPPYLKPQTLRQMISIHGPVTNLFLTPEPPAAYHHRVHTHHGNKKRQYIDGWVEFKHKRHAKACVDALNGRTTAEGLGVGAIGGRKGGKGRWYRDDVWSVKYLRGFSWENLMQSARTEEREREERVRFGVIREKKQRQAFLAGIQGAKIEETRMKKRKRKRKEVAQDGIEDHPRAKGKAEDILEGRGFRQSEPCDAGSKPWEEPNGLQRVLSKVF